MSDNHDKSAVHTDISSLLQVKVSKKNNIMRNRTMNLTNDITEPHYSPTTPQGLHTHTWALKLLVHLPPKHRYSLALHHMYSYMDTYNTLSTVQSSYTTYTALSVTYVYYGVLCSIHCTDCRMIGLVLVLGSYGAREFFRCTLQSG